jgi:hypothetical protein
MQAGSGVILPAPSGQAHNIIECASEGAIPSQGHFARDAITE